MYETWSWHTYSFAFGFVLKTGCHSYRDCWLDFPLYPEKIDRQGRRNFCQASDVPMLGHRLNRCYCFFFVFSWIDLDLISTSIVSSSKCCVDFFWLSWAVFERVCNISKANSILIKLLTHEPLLIVRSRTRNYKT